MYVSLGCSRPTHFVPPWGGVKYELQQKRLLGRLIRRRTVQINDLDECVGQLQRRLTYIHNLNTIAIKDIKAWGVVRDLQVTGIHRVTKMT